MLASVIFGGASKILSDEGNDRWTTTKLLTYINQVRRRIVVLKPEQFSTFVTVQLTAGIRQSVPANCAVLRGLIRNMGSDGLIPGAAIHSIDRSSLDAYDPAWVNSSGTVILEFMYESGADHYLVNPGCPSTSDVYIELELASYLADLTQTDGSEAVSIPDKYEMAMVYWLCHMSFSEDSEDGSAARAKYYYGSFLSEIGVTAK